MRIGWTDINKWDLRFLQMAYLVSTWSKDPSTKLGAVITKNNRVISVGYNGFSSRIKDDERLNNRELKYKMVIHGEINAFHKAHKLDLEDSTLYTFPFMSCSVCFAQGLEVGLVRHVTPYNENPRWIDSFKLTRSMANEANVELIEVDFDTDYINEKVLQTLL